ncbi:hypothetical protein BDW66DRAFT_127884 [Aspergillus desertorum]
MGLRPISSARTRGLLGQSRLVAWNTLGAVFQERRFFQSSGHWTELWTRLSRRSDSFELVVRGATVICMTASVIAAVYIQRVLLSQDWKILESSILTFEVLF